MDFNNIVFLKTVYFLNCESFCLIGKSPKSENCESRVGAFNAFVDETRTISIDLFYYNFDTFDEKCYRILINFKLAATNS